MLRPALPLSLSCFCVGSGFGWSRPGEHRLRRTGSVLEHCEQMSNVTLGGGPGPGLALAWLWPQLTFKRQFCEPASGSQRSCLSSQQSLPAWGGGQFGGGGQCACLAADPTLLCLTFHLRKAGAASRGCDNETSSRSHPGLGAGSVLAATHPLLGSRVLLPWPCLLRGSLCHRHNSLKLFSSFPWICVVSATQRAFCWHMQPMPTHAWLQVTRGLGWQQCCAPECPVVAFARAPSACSLGVPSTADWDVSVCWDRCAVSRGNSTHLAFVLQMCQPACQGQEQLGLNIPGNPISPPPHPRPPPRDKCERDVGFLHAR